MSQKRAYKQYTKEFKEEAAALVLEQGYSVPEASKKWSMPIHNWRQAMVRFIIEFGDRLEKHIN